MADYAPGLFTNDERLAAVKAELVDLAAGQRRLETAIAALPSALAAAVCGQDSQTESEVGVGTVRRMSSHQREFEMGASASSLSNVESFVPTSRRKGAAPTSWPMNLPIQDHLVARRRALVSMDARRFMMGTVTPPTAESAASKGAGVVEDFIVGQVSRCPIFEPDSLWLIPHKVAVIIALVHDLIIQPYVLAWDVPFKGEVLNTAEIAVGFWWLDLVLNFFIAYYKDGTLVKRVKLIGRKYFRTWFVPDFLAVLGDIVSLSDVVRDYLGRRFALRSIGVLRIHKLESMFDLILESSLSENWRLAFKALRFGFFMIWLNHIVCCTWYSIGVNAPSDTGWRWLDHMAELGEDPQHPRDLYRYATAFHWSMGQIMAGGVENLGALNSVERWYSIFILAIGMVTFSAVVSALSTAMMEIQMLHQERNEKMRNLRLFLSQNSITQKMKLRVQKQVAERMKMKKRLTDKDVLALSHLSLNLQAELRYEISGPYLLTMPILRICAYIDEATVQACCGEAIDVVSLARLDFLFTVDQDAPAGYYLIDGLLLYSLKSNGVFRQDNNRDNTPQEVKPGTWISEAALWTKWRHVGSMEAAENCQVLTLRSTHLVNGLLKHDLIGAIAAEYGRQFHRRVVNAVPPRSSWPTDLSVPFTEYAELVLAMEPIVQELVGQVTLVHVQKSRKMDVVSFNELVKEVKDGKCAVMLNGKGEMERGVTITVLSCETENSLVLVHIGKYKIGKALNPLCQLPGAKNESHESPGESVSRLLDRVRPLVGKLHLRTMEQEVVWKESPTYGMRTRYFRAVHHAHMVRIPEGGPAKAVPHKPTAVLTGVPEIYVLTQQNDSESFDFYAWLPQADFACMEAAANGKQEILGWLETVDLDKLALAAPPPPSARSAMRTSARPITDRTSKSSNSFLVDDEDGRLLFGSHVMDVPTENLDSEADTPREPAPVKWEVEDWTVPELLTPKLPPSNRLPPVGSTGAALSWTQAYGDPEGSSSFQPFEDSHTASPRRPPPLLTQPPSAGVGDPFASPLQSARTGGGRRDRRRFTLRGGDL